MLILKKFRFRGVGKRSLIETLKKSKVFCSEKRIKLSEVPGEVIPEDEDEDNAFDKAQSFVERYKSLFTVVTDKSMILRIYRVSHD